jgi:hypothetical protein
MEGCPVTRRSSLAFAALAAFSVCLARPAGAAGMYFQCFADTPTTLSYESNVPGRIAVTVNGPIDERTLLFADVTATAVAQRANLKCSAPAGEVVGGGGSITLRLWPTAGGASPFADCVVRYDCGGGGLKLKKD